MHGADGHGSCRRSGEDELQLSRQVNDEELAKRCGGGESEIATHNGQCNESTEVLLGCGEQTQLVERWNTGYEHTAETTCGSGSSLDNVVLTWTELPAKDGKTFRKFAA